MIRNPQHEQQLLALIQQGDFATLQAQILGMPFDQALEMCFHVFGAMTQDERAAFFRRRFGMQPRIAGIVTVAGELRMPQELVFGPGVMNSGDALTDYDRARTFILQKIKTSPGNRTRVTPPFYPEVYFLDPVERVMTLAAAHIDCDPTKQKQINLFSLCGRFSYKEATRTTQPNGTTCALFARAVLVAVEDTRFSEKVLDEPGKQAQMIPYLGLSHVNPPYDYRIVGPGWISTYPAPPATPSLPSRGDFYFIRKQSGGADSGHVGLIESASGGPNSMVWSTIDGGQGSPGHKTIRTKSRTFSKSGSNWITQSSGMERALIGWLNFQAVSTQLRTGTHPYIALPDGRRIYTEL